MSMGDVAIQLAISLVEVVVYVVEHSFGLSEAKAKKIVDVIALIFLGVVIFGLLYITFKYS